MCTDVQTKVGRFLTRTIRDNIETQPPVARICSHELKTDRGAVIAKPTNKRLWKEDQHGIARE